MSLGLSVPLALARPYMLRSAPLCAVLCSGLVRPPLPSGGLRVVERVRSADDADVLFVPVFSSALFAACLGSCVTTSGESPPLHARSLACLPACAHCAVLKHGAWWIKEQAEFVYSCGCVLRFCGSERVERLLCLRPCLLSRCH